MNVNGISISLIFRNTDRSFVSREMETINPSTRIERSVRTCRISRSAFSPDTVRTIS